MMFAMREFEWSFDIGLYAGAAAVALGLILSVGVLALLGRTLFKGRRSTRS